MAADPETLARHNGKPLLSEEGMAAVDSLLDAHVQYDEAGGLNATEVTELNDEIKTLEDRRDALLSERKDETGKQHKARHSGVFRVKEAVENPAKSDNPVYATVLKAIESDGQGALWYPNTLEAADRMGKSLVAFDEGIRSAHTAQPAMIIERERNNYANVYLAKTKRTGRLQPSTVSVKEPQGPYSTVTRQRDALALPVNNRQAVALQIHPNSFGDKASLGDYSYGKGPGLRDVRDSFKIILPQGNIFCELEQIGRYDLADGSTATIEGSLTHWTVLNNLHIAVGELSVKQALASLQHEFAEASTRPADEAWKQQLAFDQLTQLAFGDIKLPKASAERPKRVATNFS